MARTKGGRRREGRRGVTRGPCCTYKWGVEGDVVKIGGIPHCPVTPQLS